MGKWTTATIVQQYLKGAGTSLTTAEIDIFINMNEGIIEGLLKIPKSYVFESLSVFSAPFAVRKLVSLLSALDIIAATPQSFNSFTAIDASQKTLRAQWDQVLSIVNTPHFMDFVMDVEG